MSETIQERLRNPPCLCILDTEEAADRIDALEAENARLEAGIKRLHPRNAERYWEERWRDNEADNKRLREALLHTTASLVAAISLLERGSKKAAASDAMFDQMIIDYKAAVDASRAALTAALNGG